MIEALKYRVVGVPFLDPLTDSEEGGGEEWDVFELIVDGEHPLIV